MLIHLSHQLLIPIESRTILKWSILFNANVEQQHQPNIVIHLYVNLNLHLSIDLPHDQQFMLNMILILNISDINIQDQMSLTVDVDIPDINPIIQPNLQVTINLDSNLNQISQSLITI